MCVGENLVTLPTKKPIKMTFTVTQNHDAK